MRQQWSIGIDPGFGETGLVLRHGTRVREFGVLSCRAGPPPVSRTFALTQRVMDLVQQWVMRYKIRELDVAIERPIWNKNASAFELQWRLVQHLESSLYQIADTMQLWITEVSPGTSKKLATGNGGADKNEVAAASPFGPEDFPQGNTWTTLGDAWAHSLAAWTEGDGRLRLSYTDMKFANVREFDLGGLEE